MEKTTPRLIAKCLGQTKYVGAPCIHGHSGERFVRNNSCVQCHKQHQSETEIAKRKLRGLKKKGRPRKYPDLLGPPKPKRKTFTPITDVERWIVRSKRKKYGARKELTLEEYKKLIVKYCPLLELELIYEWPRGWSLPDNYATLDRIDSTKGYELGNVQIISYRANTLKSNATLEEVERLAKNWRQSV